MINPSEYIYGDRFRELNGPGIQFFKKEDFTPRDHPDLRVAITHNSDYPVTIEEADQLPPGVIWFGMNVALGARAVPIPIGLENDYISTAKEKRRLIEIMSRTKYQPTKLAYVNHRVETNPEEREKGYRYLSGRDGFTVENHGLRLPDYYHRILDHKFTLCPPGNGFDCHRTWEVLYLNRIPLLHKEVYPEELFSGLPVLFFDDYDQLTRDFLEKAVVTCTSPRKLTFSYWAELIRCSTLTNG